MGLVKRIDTVGELAREFESYHRDYYSTDAYETMLDYYNDFGEDVEIDVIGMCCEFNEYQDPWEAINDYNLEDWIDKIDLSDFGMPISEWLDNIEDKDEFFEYLPEDVCYYDDELDEYVIPDYSKVITLGDLGGGYDKFLVESEIQNWDNFGDIVNEYAYLEELTDLLVDELSDNTTAWKLDNGNILLIAY